MTRIIPNENTWVGFAPTVADKSAPTAANVTAAVNLTGYVISLNASSNGNTVPTPSFDTLFETSIPGTVQASFSADFYRDDEEDLAWETLPRSTKGFFILARFGGTGTGNAPQGGDDVEVWPVIVTSRTMANESSNTALTFTVTCSVPDEPAEDAVIAS